MSAKKMGLGRGLNTLIPKAPIVDEEDVEQVKKKVSRSSKTKKKEETKKELTLPIDKIEPNPDHFSLHLNLLLHHAWQHSMPDSRRHWLKFQFLT